jgi:hypothetical protein
MDDETRELIAEQNYELGQIVAIEDVAKNFLERAGDYFKSNNDDMAHLMRNEANKLRDKAAARREKYEIKYHEDTQ